jgi:parallel beta-helix repeat protein
MSSANNISNCDIYKTEASGYQGGFGILIDDKSNDNIVQDCHIRNNDLGIYLIESDYNTIQNTSIYYNDYGIALYSSSDYNTFDNVDVINNFETGIQLYESYTNLFKDSNIHYNSVGFYVEDSHSNQFTGLKVVGNGNWGLSFVWSIYNTISGCKIQDHLGGGVGFYGCDFNYLINSNISNNGNYGIYIDSSINIYIDNTDIYNNGCGIYSYEYTTVYILNSRITTAPGYSDFFIEDTADHDLGGEVTTLNTIFDPDKVDFSKAYDSQLTVQWYLHIRVFDQYMNPLPDTVIYLWNDYEGIENQVYYISDDDGWIRYIICTDYIQYPSDRIDYNPYTMSSDLPGYGLYNKQITIDHTQTVYFILSPIDLIAQKLTYSTTIPVISEDFYINATIYNNNPNTVYDIDVRYKITHGSNTIYSTTFEIAEIPAYGTNTSSLLINFTQAGDYTIEFEVDIYHHINEANEDNNTIIETFTVYEKPDAVLEASSTSIDVNQKVFFYGNNSRSYTGTIISYIFDFGDGSPVYKTPLFYTDHVYTEQESYYASLRIVDDNGKYSDKAYLVIQVKKPTAPNQKPVANFTITPESGNVTTSFKFVSTSYCPDVGGWIESYLWDFGDGNTSNWISPVHKYYNDGVYEVSLLVWDDDYDRSDYFNDTITVNNLPPEPVLIASKYEVALHEAIEFDASYTTDPDDTLDEISTVFIWDFDDGETYSESPINFLDGVYDKKTIHPYSKPGLYNVTLTVIDDNNAPNSTIVQIKVNSTGEPGSGPDDDDATAWLEANAQLAVVIISFLIAIILAVIMVLIYRKKRKISQEPEKGEEEVKTPESYKPVSQYADTSPPVTVPEQDKGFKPHEFDVGVEGGLAPTDITPVSKRNRKKKKKAKTKKAKKELEVPATYKEDIAAEEEAEWDFGEAEIEEIEAKRSATVVEYPELGEEDEIKVEDEEIDIGVEIEPDLETEPEPEVEIEPDLETELEIEEPPILDPKIPLEVEEEIVEPAWAAPMPSVEKPSKPKCRWCEREIKGKYIKGRRKRDPKTGDEFFVEGPFCSMKCANEFFKD